MRMKSHRLLLETLYLGHALLHRAQMSHAISKPITYLCVRLSAQYLKAKSHSDSPNVFRVCSYETLLSAITRYFIEVCNEVWYLTTADCILNCMLPS